MTDAPAAAAGPGLATRPLHHEGDPAARERLGALLAAQRAAFTSSPPGYTARLEALRTLERAILRRKDDLAAAVSADYGGRAAEETLALELFPLLNEIRHARRRLKRWMKPRRAHRQWQFWPGTGRIVYEPLGVVGILSTWNYPVFLTLGPLTGVLAAGNHAIVKPSELGPRTAALMAEILSGLYPASYVAVVEGGPDVAAALTRLPLDHLMFTGSTRVGRLVMKAASENLVPVTLELGGKSPAIVHSACDIDRAAARIVAGKLYTAGQTCVAPDYVLVSEDRRDALVDAARRHIARMYPALVANRDYTRIINADHYRRLEGLVDDARSLGGTVLSINPAGEICDADNRVFPPALIVGPTPAMQVMQEEIFGPVLPIVAYRTIDEAIAFVNARPRPLALYYFDDDSGRAAHVVARIPSGGVTLNDCIFHVGHAGLPFGGVGASGMGRYHGFDGFEAFSHKRGIFIQRRIAPLGLVRPPYAPAARRLIETLLRWG